MTNYADSIKHVEDYIQLPLLYNHWYVAGTCDEFGRDPKARTLLERSIVFYRSTDGQLIASQNRCLHRAFPLSESKLEGDELVCGYHGIRYNTEGLMVRVPSQKKCPERKLRMYPVVEQGPFVFIWMGDEDAPDMDRLGDFLFLADSEMLTLHGQHHLDGSYLLMQENLNDLTHFAYLHHDSAGFDDGFLELPTFTEETPEGVSCYRVQRDPAEASKFLPPDVQARIGDRPVEQWDGGVAISPGVFKGDAPIKVGEPDSPDVEIFNRYIMHYLTPETATTHHYWWSVTDDYSPNIPEVNEIMTAGLGRRRVRSFERLSGSTYQPIDADDATLAATFRHRSSSGRASIGLHRAPNRSAAKRCSPRNSRRTAATLAHRVGIATTTTQPPRSPSSSSGPV